MLPFSCDLRIPALCLLGKGFSSLPLHFRFSAGTSFFFGLALVYPGQQAPQTIRDVLPLTSSSWAFLEFSPPASLFVFSRLSPGADMFSLKTDCCNSHLPFPNITNPRPVTEPLLPFPYYSDFYFWASDPPFAHSSLVPLSRASAAQ